MPIGIVLLAACNEIALKADCNLLYRVIGDIDTDCVIGELQCKHQQGGSWSVTDAQ